MIYLQSLEEDVLEYGGKIEGGGGGEKGESVHTNQYMQSHH